MVKLAITSDLAALRSHVDLAGRLFSQVTTQHDPVVSGHHVASELHNQAVGQAKATMASLLDDLAWAETEAATDRATIRVLGMRVPTPVGGTSRPIPISDHAMFDGSKHDLEAFLDRLANKLGGDDAQFTSEIHQISYLVSRITGTRSNISGAPTPPTPPP